MFKKEEGKKSEPSDFRFSPEPLISPHRGHICALLVIVTLGVNDDVFILVFSFIYLLSCDILSEGDGDGRGRGYNVGAGRNKEMNKQRGKDIRSIHIHADEQKKMMNKNNKLLTMTPQGEDDKGHLFSKRKKGVQMDTNATI